MIARTRSSLMESELKLLQAKNQLMAKVQGELREVQARLPNLREQYRAAEQAYERMTVRAPVPGYVLAPRMTTVGAVVREAEPAARHAGRGHDQDGRTHSACLSDTAAARQHQQGLARVTRQT